MDEDTNKFQRKNFKEYEKKKRKKILKKTEKQKSQT